MDGPEKSPNFLFSTKKVMSNSLKSVRKEHETSSLLPTLIGLDHAWAFGGSPCPLLHGAPSCSLPTCVSWTLNRKVSLKSCARFHSFGGPMLAQNCFFLPAQSKGFHQCQCHAMLSTGRVGARRRWDLNLGTCETPPEAFDSAAHFRPPKGRRSDARTHLQQSTRLLSAPLLQA